MIKSMTGFGRSEYQDGKRNITVEIRSVNHRYCDINVKTPRRYSFTEEAVKRIAKETVRRGKVEISIMFENIREDDVSVKLNSSVAKQYYDNLSELKETYELPGEVDLALLAQQQDVLKAIPDVADEEEVIMSVSKAVSQGIMNLDIMRTTEGEKLAEDLRMRGGLIRNMVLDIKARAPIVTEDYTKRLNDRISEVLNGSVEIPQDRILVEAAIFADKCSITEELVRLDSHMIQLDNILRSSDQPVGKKLDFLVQEMNREANTIGSKANDLKITELMLEIKSEIEKIREQVQNIE